MGTLTERQVEHTDSRAGGYQHIWIGGHTDSGTGRQTNSRTDGHICGRTA